jgi:hypothetical protein
VPVLALSPLELTAKSSLDKWSAAKTAIAALENRVKPAMDAYLFDPFSARYRELRVGRGGALCGQVNAKNRMGAYVGFKDFVLDDDGKSLFISRNSNGVATELYTDFAQAWVDACATKEERQRYAVLTRPDDDYYYAEDAATAAAAAAATAAAASTDALEDPFADE